MADNFCRPRWLEQAHADLRRHEGFRPYAYPDPLSVLGKKYGKEFGYKPATEVISKLGVDPKQGAPWTIGYGFTHGVTVGSVMSREEADERLYEEIMKHASALDDLVPDWAQAPLYVQTTLVNLVFNMGKSGLAKFKNTLALFNAGKWAEAGRALTNSLWYKQVGNRAVELTQRMITGVIPDKYAV